jgi:hypothetical protein
MRPHILPQRALALLSALVVVVACTDAAIPNYNNPVIPAVVPSVAALQSQVTGIAAGDRENHAFQILIMETMGRDAYRIDAADPRYINNPLGQFNPSAFVTNFLWNSHFRTVRSSNELVAAIAGSGFSTTEKAGVRGYAQTMKALEYIRLIEMRDTIGVPIVLGQGALDPIRCKPAVLTYISALLDSAATDLAAAGSTFAFVLPGGFGSNGTFNTPAGFLRFNRGLKAKNDVYRGFVNYARTGAVDAAALNAAITALDASFQSTAGNFRDGVYHIYSTASGDLTNQNFDNSVYRAAANTSTEGVSSDLLFTIFSGPTSPIPLLINEELTLVRAEALWGLNNDGGALAIVNAVRTRSGGFATPLPPFANRMNLLREILKQNATRCCTRARRARWTTGCSASGPSSGPSARRRTSGRG